MSLRGAQRRGNLIPSVIPAEAAIQKNSELPTLNHEILFAPSVFSAII